MFLHEQGARRLYVLFLRPFLQEHGVQIDAIVNFFSSFRVRRFVLHRYPQPQALIDPCDASQGKRLTSE